jgi:hypothetical protein
MSAISGIAQRTAHRMHFKAAALKPPAADSTNVTSGSLSGSVTGSSQLLSSISGKSTVPPGLMKQIEQAVTSALQSSKPTDDPHQVVQNAIASVLKKNGGTAVTQGAGAAGDASDADGSQRTFQQTLQAYGITPQQFGAQLASALHPTSAGQSNLSSYPPGLVLDTSA